MHFVYDYQQSATLSITCGVPQGSVLGPLLFIIYMNVICNVSQLLFTVLYADDTCVLVNGKSLNLIIETVNSELQLLSTWLKSNKLSLNTTKSYYAVFHRARMKLPNNSIKLKIENTNIKEVQSIKYIGVILDNKLSWIQHISYVKSKISKGIGIMYKARNYVNKNALLGLYHSYIYPYLIYCIESWGTASNCHIDPLYILQKRILRILTFSNYDVPSKLLFRYTNILPLCKLVHYRIGIRMYKYANYLLPPVINSIYTVNSDIHEYNTRQKHILHTNKGSTNQFNKCFSNISARVWNALQKAIDVNVSASKFKQILCVCWMHQNHLILFNKLKLRNMCPTILKCLMCTNQRQSVMVNWNGECSSTFSVGNDVKQGGVLSPVLFTVYIDGLIDQLRKKGLGCHFNDHFVGCFIYTDDITLLAPSRDALNDMLDVCGCQYT